MTDETYPVLREVLAEHEMHGWAVEFGVWSGESMKIIAECMPVIGFDSFEGLPEDWRPEFPKGAFRVIEDSSSIVDFSAPPNTMIVPGWFEDTVPGFPFPDLSLVHIDCDLHSSTVTALDGVKGRVDVGTIIVMDEHHGYEGWEDHEALAFDQWRELWGIKVEQIAWGREEAAFRIIQ